ncbi:MAG: hypothetical protein MZW92_78490 [Comamonadaceae bacterium]|nr:hypothetical protein [Comamonadaceae bacterium]
MAARGHLRHVRARRRHHAVPAAAVLDRRCSRQEPVRRAGHGRRARVRWCGASR